jgi:hypothetical protein
VSNGNVTVITRLFLQCQVSASLRTGELQELINFPSDISAAIYHASIYFVKWKGMLRIFK